MPLNIANVVEVRMNFFDGHTRLKFLSSKCDENFKIGWYARSFDPTMSVAKIINRILTHPHEVRNQWEYYGDEVPPDEGGIVYKPHRIKQVQQKMLTR